MSYRSGTGGLVAYSRQTFHFHSLGCSTALFCVLKGRHGRHLEIMLDGQYFSQYLCYFVVGMQLSYIAFGLTNDNPEITAPVYKQYRYVQYSGGVPSTPTVSVSFPPTGDMFQYAILQQQFATSELICLAEVKVFLRGRPSLHRHKNTVRNRLENFVASCHKSHRSSCRPITNVLSDSYGLVQRSIDLLERDMGLGDVYVYT